MNNINSTKELATNVKDETLAIDGDNYVINLIKQNLLGVRWRKVGERLIKARRFGFGGQYCEAVI